MNRTKIKIENKNQIKNRNWYVTKAHGIGTQLLLRFEFLHWVYNLFSCDIRFYIFRWHEPCGYTICAKLLNYWTRCSLYWERNKIKSPDCICTIIHWCQSVVLSALNTLRVSLKSLSLQAKWRIHHEIVSSLHSDAVVTNYGATLHCHREMCAMCTLHFMLPIFHSIFLHHFCAFSIL